MNKSEFTAQIAERAGITKVQAASVLSAMTDAVTAALKAGDKVAIPGFGTFETRIRAARTGVNPATHEPLEIPETVVPAFKPGAALKEAIRG